MTDPSPAYEALLRRVVTEDGYVDWGALRADREPLDAYVAWLARPGAVPEPTDAAHATWLNAYNAWTLFEVLEAGTPASVRDVSGWVPEPGSGFFLERTFDLGGQRVSLYTAEQVWIRPTFEDWRDHAAINCASASCPALRRDLFRADTLDAQLDDAARRWADDPVRGWHREGQTFVFSPIFTWYADDFPGGDDELCALLAGYATGARKAALQAGDAAGCPTAFFEYDWRLNHPAVREQVPPRVD